LKEFKKNRLEIAQGVIKDALKKPIIKKSSIHHHLQGERNNYILPSFIENENSPFQK